MSFNQEKHDIVMKHDEEDKRGSDLAATAIEEDQAAHILHILSEVYGHLEDIAHILSDLKVDKAAVDFGAGHPGMRVVERISEMEETITKTVEATSLLYDHVHCAEKDKKLKQNMTKPNPTPPSPSTPPSSAPSMRQIDLLSLQSLHFVKAARHNPISTAGPGWHV